MSAAQSSTWDVAVDNQTDSGGRLWSYAWYFNTGSFSSTYAWDGSVYTVVDGGSSTDTAVVEFVAEGLSGFVWTLLANSDGVTGANGRSVAHTGAETVNYE